jgi:hypothetical protein
MSVNLVIRRLVIDRSALAPGQEASFETGLRGELGRLIGAHGISHAPHPGREHDPAKPVHMGGTGVRLGEAVARTIHSRIGR